MGIINWIESFFEKQINLQKLSEETGYRIISYETRHELYNEPKGNYGNFYSHCMDNYLEYGKDKNKKWFNFNGDYLGEGLIHASEFNLNEKMGGIIIFSTTINVNKNNESFFKKVKNLLSNKLKTLKNDLLVQKKVLKSIVSSKPENIGFTLGKGFRGKYVDKNGNIYDDKSYTIELLGVPSEELIKIATQIARDFEQDSVLVRDYDKGIFYFADKS